MVPRRPTAAVAVALLLVLAGCSGLVGSDATDAPPATTASDGATPPSDTHTDATPTNAPDPAGPEPGTRATAPTPTGTPPPAPLTVTRTEPPAPPTPTRTPSPAPTATPTSVPPTTTPPTDTATPGPEADGVGESARVPVEGALPVNATSVYRRTERLMGVSDEVPTVQVENRTVDPSLGGPGPVGRALGFGEATGPVTECGTLGSGSAGGGTVQVSTTNLTAASVELLLVHEYAHVLQDDVRGYENATRSLDATRGAMLEGSAVYVADAYARRYGLTWEGKTPLELRECFYDRAENRVKLLTGQYYFGGDYFAGRLDSAANLEAVFETPPETAEQLVHGLAPSAEPAAPLSVSVTESPDWLADRSRQRGEIFVRTWLSTALSDERVDAAATGWGNDTLVPFGHEGDTAAVAWTLRWDSATDADEFASAVADLAPTLESRRDTAIRQVRVAPDTVVVFAGAASFVANATASGTSGNVTVAPP